MWKKIGTLLGANTLGLLVSLAFLPLLSRIYAPEAFGIYALFMSVTMIFSTISSLRYELAIVLPRSDSDAIHLRRAASNILFISTIIIFISTILVFLLFNQSGRQISLAFLGISVSVFFLGEISIRNYWLARKHKFGLQSISQILQVTVSGLTQLILGVICGAYSDWLIIGFVFGQGIVYVFLRISDKSFKNSLPVNRIYQRELIKRYKNMPLLNGPNALVDSLRINGINFVITAVASPAFLGQFSMAWRIAQAPMGLLTNSISQVLFPHLASTVPGKLRPKVIKVSTLAGLLSVVPFGVLAIVSPWLVPWLLGPEWNTAGLFVQALTPWLCLNVVTSPISNVFIVTGRQGLVLMFSLLYMVTPICILWFLGKDLIFAVWIMSISMALLLILFIGLAIFVSAQYDKHNHLP